MRTPISSAVAALPRNETLKRGVYSLAIPDRMHRYQYVLSLLPGDQVDDLFQDGLLGCQFRRHDVGMLGRAWLTSCPTRMSLADYNFWKCDLRFLTNS